MCHTHDQTIYRWTRSYKVPPSSLGCDVFQNEDISSKGILHIFSLGLWRQFSEHHHRGSILEHAVVSIYHNVAFRFRVLLTTLAQSLHALPLCRLMRVCHGYLSRKGKRHSNPLFTLHNAGTAHVGPAEIANKKRGAMENTKKTRERSN